MRSNADRAAEATQGTASLLDTLDEVISMDYVTVVIGEWIPFGMNLIRQLNDKLGSSERVQGGVFSAEIDDSPAECQFEIPSGSTEVLIIDYDSTHFVNIDAEINYPEDPGIIQIESFGIHINCDGLVCYGLHLEAVMDRIHEKITLDHLARVMVDIQQDSSKVIHPVLTTYQRMLMEVRCFDNPDCREKLALVFAEKIHPNLPVAEYMDKEEKENEIKQILGDTYDSADLAEGEVVILGRQGILIGGPNSRRHEDVMVYYISLVARQQTISQLHIRMQYLTAQISETSDLIDGFEEEPHRVDAIRARLSACSKIALLVRDTLQFLEESLESIEVPPLVELDEASNNLYRFLEVEYIKDSVQERINDLKKNVEGSQNWMQSLREMVSIIKEQLSYKSREAMTDSVKNLQGVLRATDRAATATEVMQTMLSGSLAFALLDRATGSWDVVNDPLDTTNAAPGSTWGNEYIKKTLIDKEWMWFGVNMGFWFLFGGLLMWFLGWLASRLKGVITLNFKMCQRIDLKQLKRYLKLKGVDDLDESFEMDDKQCLRKCSWEEANRVVWQGTPPKIDMYIDMLHGYIINVTIVYNKNTGLLRDTDLKTVLIDELEATEVIEKTEALKEDAWKFDKKVIKDWSYDDDGGMDQEASLINSS